jgi:YegS/Rv2252/BmrU family lipid kinase
VAERTPRNQKQQPFAVAEHIPRITAIVSGTSRLGAEAVSALLARHLDPLTQVHVYTANSSREATLTASDAAESADVVVAVGGDGTVADVATGIFGSDAALGIVPAGTTNITGRSLGIPADPADALALLGHQRVYRSIDVGRSGDRSFLHIAGAGFDAQLFSSANPDWKRRVGWVAYLPAAAAALAVPPAEVRVIADEIEIVADSALVLIANGGSAIAPGFKIFPGVSVEDGWLDVLLFTPSTPAEIATTLWHAGMQRLDRSPHVIWSRARTVKIEAAPPLPVELDGDPRGHTPREFQVVPSGLTVVVPDPA